jgi:hypothetical protein
MSDDAAFERATSDWLEAGSDRTPPEVIDAVLLAVRTTPQERDLRIPWRVTPMPSFLRLVAAVAIIAIAGVTGLTYLNGRPDPGVGAVATPSPTQLSTPSPSPTVEPSPTANPLLDTSTWTPYTSGQYGFTIGHPGDWTVEQADRAWSLETDAADMFATTAADSFFTSGAADGLGVRLSVWSVPFEYANDETFDEVEAWVQTYCEAAGSPTCARMRDVAVPLCIEVRDCHPGLLVAGSSLDTQAFFSGGIYSDQMVVVSIWRTDNDPAVAPYGGGRKLLEAFLSTMCVWPEDSRPEPPGGCLATP